MNSLPASVNSLLMIKPSLMEKQNRQRDSFRGYRERKTRFHHSFVEILATSTSNKEIIWEKII